MSADGRRLYVADRDASKVSVFGITPRAGGMTEVPGSPFPATGGRGMAVVAPRARCAGKRATMLARGTAGLKGTAGADVIVGDSAANRIDGAGGGDLICAGRGDDSVGGGSGNDRLHGQRGNDRLYGQRGNDRVAGGRGRDRLDCGRGRDRARADGRDRLRRCELDRARSWFSIRTPRLKKWSTRPPTGSSPVVRRSVMKPVEQPSDRCREQR